MEFIYDPSFSAVMTRTPEFHDCMLLKATNAAAMYSSVVAHRTGELAASVRGEALSGDAGWYGKVTSTVSYAASYEFGVDVHDPGPARAPSWVRGAQHKFLPVLEALPGL